MTDIVERLRASAAETRAKVALVGQFEMTAVQPLVDEMQRSAGSVDEAADEIERLRNNNGNLLLEVADLHIKIGGLNAEIERLRTPRKFKPRFRPRPEAKP